MQFSMQEYWSGLPFPLQRLVLTQGLNPYLLHWQADSLPLSHLGSPTASPYSFGNHIHPPLESTITWRRWLLWLKLFIFSPNLSRSLPRCPVETSQQVQMTSSPKPLGSATTTIIAWIQTLHMGSFFCLHYHPPAPSLSLLLYPAMVQHPSPLISWQVGSVSSLSPSSSAGSPARHSVAAWDMHTPMSLPWVRGHSYRMGTQS